MSQSPDEPLDTDPAHQDPEDPAEEPTAYADEPEQGDTQDPAVTP